MIVVRILVVVWSVLLVVMATLLAWYLIERWRDRSGDWVLWEDDLAPGLVVLARRELLAEQAEEQAYERHREAEIRETDSLDEQAAMYAPEDFDDPREPW